MKKNQPIYGLIQEIEWFPKIEVVIYATLGIKRCSYFCYPDKLLKICNDNNFSIQRFYKILNLLDLVIQKDFFITAEAWPDYDYFYKKHHIESSCRSDNVEGLFLDIPECCATTYAEKGDVCDRAILQKYPFRGINIPEGLCAIYPDNDDKEGREKWWKEFRRHFIDHKNGVYDHSAEVKQLVEKKIAEKKLPREVWLLFSTFIPCAPDCDKFMSMAKKMNSALKTYLSRDRYDKIINSYISGEQCL
ncbi:hypothetical protein A2303_00160 [Candidatus Falkowbacteria bacterium RIFOXYB2_FULL_47_14]|uniref:Uncharacterized protein n=1 Tax=Candidatus Falkowbacteria bacterium RIFOXYA2_FULL_47_19 TaxID=1797994 RepID=A0A1F5SN34_9BACT|nr:MAG: hypothetical protein A2227_01440 [Candidatus Falkowbacteria bacterium RIFOXYA2_FULL_47_19]OGF36806.1 MAG: hypothetical protein A2468_03325 [Candidatus Falkowbacteria bacterium RIFOXYC2_FULL_46_15]OGF44068.1 MAG: hypothetical protein A2303_00160 [Candidatus Falkowbacteria bacterium RIFOXYB2_FULL_47_14]